MSGFQRPRPIVLLLLIYSWAAFKGAERLFRGSVDADRILFAQVGLDWVAVPATVVILILDVLAVVFLLRPRSVGLAICSASLLLSAVQTTAGTVIGMWYPDALRSAMTISRESRGLAVREGAVELAQDPAVSLLMLAATLGIYGFLAVVLFRNRAYFSTAARRQRRALKPLL